MLFVTIDDVPGGSAGIKLESGHILHLGRAAKKGTAEVWLPTSVKRILEAGTDGVRIVADMVKRFESRTSNENRSILPPDTALLAPIPDPALVLAVGLAYRSHLAEMSGTPTPKAPTAFMKAPTSISGPDTTVSLPPQAPDRVDYEGELAIVIGRECHNVRADDAMEFVAGFTIANDISARDWVQAVWQAKEPWEARQTWEVNIMGKQLPGFTALGPTLLTKDSVENIGELRIITRVNGEIMQEAPVSDMIFPIADVIAYFSKWYTFRPGDILLTGTPAGVGVGRKPPVFLKAGDQVTITVDQIGVLATRVIASTTPDTVEHSWL